MVYSGYKATGQTTTLSQHVNVGARIKTSDYSFYGHSRTDYRPHATVTRLKVLHAPADATVVEGYALTESGDPVREPCCVCEYDMATVIALEQVVSSLPNDLMTYTQGQMERLVQAIHAMQAGSKVMLLTGAVKTYDVFEGKGLSSGITGSSRVEEELLIDFPELWGKYAAYSAIAIKAREPKHTLAVFTVAATNISVVHNNQPLFYQDEQNKHRRMEDMGAHIGSLLYSAGRAPGNARHVVSPVVHVSTLVARVTSKQQLLTAKSG
jgi:hypothetical protein